MDQTDDATQVQVRATADVHETLDRLTSLAGGARESAHKTSDEAQQMQGVVESLRALLSHFKLGRRTGGTKVRSIMRKASDI